MTIPVFTVNPASLTNTLKIFPLSQPPQAVTAAATVSNACGAGVSNCFGYFLQVSASSPQVYTFSSGSLGSPVPPASTTSATYSFTATASDCANPPSPAFLNGASATSGSATSVAAMSFTGCTPPQ